MATTISPIKILSDLGLNPWEIENDEDYLRALKEGIITIEAATKGKGDKRSVILREELIRVRKEPKKTQAKEKKTTIKAKNFLPGTTFRPEDIKPVDVEKKGDAPALMPDRLDNIAKTVDSIALLLRRQFKLETKQQRDARVKQDKDNKDAREDDLEKKPKDKKTGGLPKVIAKPALNFFEKIKNFFLNIVIGSAVFKMLDWLKDPANAEKIAKFSEFLINNAPLIIGGLATLAALPVILTVVSVVKGILAGLALLGPLLPALPWILGAILVGAVAWWIGKKLFGEKTGRKVINEERKENLIRLRKAGILSAKEKELTIKAESGGGEMRVPMYGENSLTGREAQEGEQANATLKLNLLKPQHADWYAKNYGQEALDAKLAAHSSFRETKSALIDKTKMMEKEINEVRAKYKPSLMANKGLSGKERKEWKRLKRERAAEIKAIREKYANQAIQIGDKSSSSATIDKTLKKETNISPPNTTGKGNTTIIGGGGDKQQSVGGGGGTTGSSAPSFSSQDPNNLGTFSTQGMYNMVG